MQIHAPVVGAAAALCLVVSAGAGEHPVNLLTADSGTTLGGYVSISAGWSPGAGTAFLPAYKYGGSAKSDGFNLDVVNLTLEHPLDETQFAAGYRVDLLFGPDAAAFGSQSTGILGDLAIRQAYVELLVPIENGLHLKFGVFDRTLGYESFDTTVDAHFTRSWGHTIEPSTHTGMLASYAFDHEWSADLGVADTFGPVINQRASLTPGGARVESARTGLAALHFSAPESWELFHNLALSSGWVSGFQNGLGADQTSWYAGGSWVAPVTNLVVGFAFDYAGLNRQSSAPLATPAYWNATAGYTSWQFDPAWALHGRAEYATRSGNWVVPGTADRTFSATATLEWKPWRQVLTRLEFRWDRAVDGSTPFGGAGPVPVAGSRQNAFLLAANLVYRF